MREITGKVIVVECDFASYYFTYGDVTNSEEDLTEVLAEYEGKTVKVTIDVVDGG